MVKIRTAYPLEQQALEALQWRASLQNPGDRAALLANPDAITLPLQQLENGDVFVAEADGKVVGFAAVVLRDDGDMELDGLFVEPRAWRRGIGRQLVDHCSQAAKAKAAAYLHVVGNPHAAHFYFACGFSELGATATRFGPGLVLRKALA